MGGKKIGFVGLGKMGSQIVQKLLGDGLEVVVYDPNLDLVKACSALGAIPATSREDLVAKLNGQKIVWLMIPAKAVENEVTSYANLLSSEDIIIDGGNSFYQDSQRRADFCRQKSIHFVDVGTSGGILGLSNGFSLMVGGDNTVVNLLQPAFESLAKPSGGIAYIGPSGSGHYVKMIHNGIEYALMQAYAEGYDLLKYGPVANIDLGKVAAVWQKGSIINSTLNSIIEQVLTENPDLAGIDGYVATSGEAEWTLKTAREADVAMPALEQAMAVRIASQQGRVYFPTKLLAAMRNKFGGHAINKTEIK